MIEELEEYKLDSTYPASNTIKQNQNQFSMKECLTTIAWSRLILRERTI